VASGSRDAGHRQLSAARRCATTLACGLLLAGCAAIAPSFAPADGRGSTPATASLSARFCDPPKVQDAGQQDRLLRFAALVRSRLEASGAEAAVISRTGIDLDRFGVRFSHSGVAVRDGGGVPWAVRQLYYACDEQRPRLYEQGIGGFLMNTDEPRIGHVSVVLLPRESGAEVRHAVLDDRRALRLLAARYSANAYPFSVRYQNCNQWVVELLAAAWGGLADGDDLRERAQAWLAAAGYRPSVLAVDSHWVKFAAPFMPLVHLDDHPPDARDGMDFAVSMPDGIERFVRARLPQTRRIELCHDGDRVVIREGWRPIPDGCRPEPGDEVVLLD
jgi:hypothetical protein